MEGSPTTTTIPPPLLLRNLLASLFIYLDKSLFTISQNHKLLHLLRHFLLSAFLFFLRLLPSLNYPSPPKNHDSPLKHPESDNYAPNPAGDSGIARALNQLLAILNDVPVSSRKYEVVRSLAEKVLDENLREGSAVLREVNRGALSAAFGRTLNQLDTVVAEQRSYGGDGGEGGDFVGMKTKGNRVMKAVRFCGDVAWTRFGKGRSEVNRCGGSAEKLAAEVLWLGQKMAACGCVEEAVEKWASATHLAWLSLSADPRLQGSFVKVSGKLKMNTDGSKKGEHGMAGYGGVLRDEEGQWIKGFMGNLGYSSVLEAEMWGIHRGLILVYELNLQNVKFETDCQEAIKCIEEDQDSSFLFANMRQEIKHLMSRCNANLMFIPREANGVADGLAKLGRDQKEILVMLEDAPMEIQDLVIKDITHGGV